MPLTWHKARRFGRVRVAAWTCHEHRVTFYELCDAGGLSFIRKTVQGKEQTTVLHSDPWPPAQARVMWIRVLAGLAR
ncbi:hypothetical protein GCM10022252_07960 [Streptosporangium oxazolinicum]|uniref:Uncharacterized protein n=1 Tax=Streptosporangium oxazolinicum TaxID=909287 RepID=A0ABP8ADR4_9ACTN